MDQPANSFSSERSWIGRVIIAVILGEALWSLIVSVMNNLVVPWLGDVMGPSPGLPTSFTQRPYNYPDLFVSVFELCFAGLAAAVLNYFLQRPSAKKVRVVSSPVPATPVQLAPVPPPVQPPAAPIPAPPPVAAPAPAARADRIILPAPVPVSVAPKPPAPPTPVAKPVEAPPPAPAAVPPAAVVAPPAPAAAVAPPPAANPQPPAAKAPPAKPKKPKEVYYNIVGEPMPSDDD